MFIFSIIVIDRQVQVYKIGGKKMNIQTQLTLKLIEKGYDIDDFYSDRVELTKTENDYVVVASVGEEAFSVMVIDKSINETILTTKLQIERMSIEKLDEILKIAEGACNE